MQHYDKLAKRYKSTNKLLPLSPIVSIPKQTGTPTISHHFQSLINEEAIYNIEKRMFTGVASAKVGKSSIGSKQQQIYKYSTLLEAEQMALNKEKGTKVAYIYGCCKSFYQ